MHSIAYTCSHCDTHGTANIITDSSSDSSAYSSAYFHTNTSTNAKPDILATRL